MPNIITIREMGIKTSMSKHVPSSKMATFTKTDDTERWQRQGEIGTLMQRWWKRGMDQPLWKALWQFLKTVDIELSSSLEVLLLGLHPTEMNTQKLCT